jgi:hypothetical protein
MTYDPSRIDTVERQRDILRAMGHTLLDQVTRLERTAETERVRSFVRYREIRERYQESRDLIETMADRHPPVKHLFPDDFVDTLTKQRLRILSAYSTLAWSFFREPPEAVTRALGAYEVLSAERDSFKGVLSYFDQMLLDARLDDVASEALEQTRERIEKILTTLDLLLLDSPAALEEFV